MADDPNPSLRTELVTALAVLAPQIRGLHNLSTVSTGDLQASINNQIAARERRRDLIQAVLNNLDTALASLNTLESDGYPSLPQAPIVASQFDSLQEEASDLTAAVSVFVEQASRLSVGLGNPAEKTPPTNGDD